MSINYANRQAVDSGNNVIVTSPPPYLALTRYTKENGAASSVITMNDNTTEIEITTNGGPAALRWIATTDTAASVVAAVSGANYDHIIASGETRRFVVPIERQGVASIVGANKQNGLYNRYAFISAGPVSSIYAAEY